VREGSVAFRALRLEPRMWSKKKIAMWGGAGLALLLAACLALGPLVRSRAAKVAAQRGMIIEIERVWPDFGGVRLKNVRFKAGDPEWLSGELGSVDVRLGFGLGVRALRVHGGHVSLSGSLEDVSRHLRDMTKSSAEGAEEKGGERSGPDFLAEGVRLTWTGASAGETVEVEGGRVERARDQGVARGLVAFAAMRANKGAVGAKARDLSARFSRDGGATRWSEARLGGLEIEVPLGATALPISAKGASTGEASTRGYVEKAAELREQATSIAAWAAEHFAPEAPVEVNGLTVVLTHGDQKLNIGPGSLHVKHRPEALELDFAPGQRDARSNDPSGLSLRATVPAGPGEIAVYVQGGPMTLASLGVHEQDFGLIDVGRAKLEAKGNIKLSADAARLLFDGDGRASSLSVVHKSLSEEPVRGLDLAWRAAGVAELDGSLLRIDEGKIELGAIRLEAFGAIENGKDFVRIDGRANVPISDCQKMFDSLPSALVPKLTGMTMAGSFALRSGFLLDTRHPDDVKIDWDLKNHCRITSAPPEIDVARFTRPFRHIVYGEHGDKVEVVSGPGTSDWVPLRAISPFLEAAVTTTEDGGFRYHGGFDKTAIKNSIRDNLRAGKFLRGASTISMQLAKNLYLEREKNLSRKLQEAVLTTYLEQALTKDDILELYFNIVEYGPMIYGIGPAADHYFDTSPFDLSLGQALFLTSILPAPKRIYFSQTGQMSKGWLGYLHRLMKIMRDRNKINDEELLDGVSEVITYRVARSPRVRPSEDIKRDLGGDVPWIAPDGP
jgi:Transglycosylase